MPAPAPTVSFHLDQPAGWRLAAPALEIGGWLYLESGAACVDLRARVDQRVFLGLHGLDRPDVARLRPDRPAAHHSGFRVAVQVWTGARRIALDWQDAGGHWHEFFNTAPDLAALPPTPRAPKILPTARIAALLDQLYRRCRREAFSVQCREADDLLREALAFTTEEPLAAGFHAHLETPDRWLPTGADRFPVAGWAFAEDGEIVRLHAALGGAGEGDRLIFPKDRPDVAAAFPGHARAGRSGFAGLVELPAGLPGPAHLRLFAEDASGRRQLVLSRRLPLDHAAAHDPAEPLRPWQFRRCQLALLRGAFLGRYRLEDRRAAFAEIRRLREALTRSLGHAPAGPEPADPQAQQDPYARWLRTNRLTPERLDSLRTEAEAAIAAGGPLLSLLVPAYNTPERFLRELLGCLRAQLYPRWELCIADDASPQPHVRAILEAAAKSDPRIRPVFRTENGHISRATNSALATATGEFVALLDHDDLLPPDALLHVARAILDHPTAGYLYTDEDKIDDTGRRYDPQLKGGWSPEMAITHNYTHHLTTIRRSVVEAVGGLRPEFNGAQDIDLFLRCFERIAPADVVHVPFVCYHWRAHAESTATRGDQKGYLFDAARRAIAEACRRRGLRAEPMLPDWATRYACCLHQLRWDPGLLHENPATIVIPTRNHAEHLKRCLDALARTLPRESVQVVVVDAGSDDPATRALLHSLPGRTDLRCTVLGRPATDAENPARLANAGAAAADTPLVLFLRDDVEALVPGWLEELAGWLSIPGVGIAGAKLLYPDGTIHHAGLGVSRGDGLPHALFAHEPADDLGLLFLPHAARNVAAVPAACLLTTTALHRELGGFAEAEFPRAYAAADFCLRAQQRGHRVVVTPQAVLRCGGEALAESRDSEQQAFRARHGAYRDPFLGAAYEFPPAAPRLDPSHSCFAAPAAPRS